MKALPMGIMNQSDVRFLKGRKHPDRLTEEYYRQHGEFSTRVDEAIERNIARNVEAKKAGLA